MYTNIFDSHAHYDDRKFQKDLTITFDKIKNAGVKYITNIGADMPSSRSSIELAKTNDFIYGTVGVHPHVADEMTDNDLLELEKLAQHEKCVAIGEIGLDYYYDNSKRENQIKRFVDQMNLATKLAMPVVIHSRDATKDTIDIIKQFSVTCVIHSFSGSVETAEEYLNMGMYIGFTGVITFKNAKIPKEVAKIVPLNKILIETDAPYMAPEPFRGKRCDSSMVYRVAETVAEIKNMDAQELINITTSNAKTFYRINI